MTFHFLEDHRQKNKYMIYSWAYSIFIHYSFSQTHGVGFTPGSVILFLHMRKLEFRKFEWCVDGLKGREWQSWISNLGVFDAEALLPASH